MSNTTLPCLTSCIALKYVVPSIGVVTGTIMFLSSIPTVLKVRKSMKIGQVNPIPYSLITDLCLIWTLYGMFIGDYFVTAANGPGVVIGLYYTISVLGCKMSERKKLITELVLLIGMSLILASAVVAFMIVKDNTEAGKSILGWVGILFIFAFFLSPSLTIKKVITSKNSKSLDWRLSMAQLGNAALWTTYGCFSGDPFLIAPNVWGAANAIIQIICCACFDRVSTSTQSKHEVEVSQESARISSSELNGALNL
eukprot:TRINITY_DN10379_c0_g1_i1.p1 TRINITY_DN10379_c0_g1~~TRINITY_DN10379_c0_g1_i1.p1  ORF type:complete len:254 (+),score=10.64 TRINITY_DN10379_c0_g1_i1:355-1116(+)